MKTRLMSAIILILILLPTVFINHILPIIIVGLIGSIIAAYEYGNVSKSNKCHMIFFSILGYISIALYDYLTDLNIFITPFYLIILSFLTVSIYVIVKDRKYSELLNVFIALVYIGFGLASVVSLKVYDTRLLIYLVLVITMTDTFAYIVGSRIGKTKLAPSISPKKSVEGSVGGTVVAIVLGITYLVYFDFINDPVIFKGSILMGILVTLVVSVIGQIGDLFASKIKRTHNVKDFGNLLPGHGGVLDRFDSLIFGALILYTLLM